MTHRPTRPRFDRIHPGHMLRVEYGGKNINLYRITEDNDETPFDERPVLIVHSARGINLTDLTEPELDAIEGIWTAAIAAARPTVQERDAAAQAEADAGIMTNPRLWRTRPRTLDFESINNKPAIGASHERAELPSGNDPS